MKVLKSLLYFFVAVSIIISLVSFFLPNKGGFERSVMIAAPDSLIFQKINHLPNWETWSPWKDLDKSQKITYPDRLTGEGAVYTWKGDLTGTGKLTILKSNANDSIATRIDIDQNNYSLENWYFEAKEDSIEVTWRMETELHGMTKWSGLMMDQMLGPSYEKGLQNLKELCESN